MLRNRDFCLWHGQEHRHQCCFEVDVLERSGDKCKVRWRHWPKRTHWVHQKYLVSGGLLPRTKYKLGEDVVAGFRDVAQPSPGKVVGLPLDAEVPMYYIVKKFSDLDSESKGPEGEFLSEYYLHHPCELVQAGEERPCIEDVHAKVARLRVLGRCQKDAEAMVRSLHLEDVCQQLSHEQKLRHLRDKEVQELRAKSEELQQKLEHEVRAKEKAWKVAEELGFDGDVSLHDRGKEGTTGDGKTTSSPSLGLGVSDEHAYASSGIDHKAYVDEKRAERLQDPAKPNRRTLERAVAALAKDLYASKAHFIHEFIQNADDCAFPNGAVPALTMCFRAGYFFSSCNEIGFTCRDVDALCDLGNSTKGVGQTGHKGLGFRSVFAVCNQVTILSGQWTFRFDMRRDGTMGMITPSWLVETELQGLPPDVLAEHQQGHTVFYFPVHPGTASLVRSGLEEFAAHPTSMLFLRRLRRLSVSTDGTSQHLEKTVHDEYRGGVSGGEETLVIAGGASGTYWVEREIIGQSEDSTSAQAEVAVAFVLSSVTDGSDSRNESIYCTLPVRASCFGFAIHSDGFELVAARNDIKVDSSRNMMLRDVVPRLVQRAVERGPPELGLRVISHLGKSHDPFWMPCRCALLDSLKSVPCLLTRAASGAAVRPSEALLWPGEGTSAWRVAQLIPSDVVQAVLGRVWVQPPTDVEVEALTSFGCMEFTQQHLLRIVAHAEAHQWLYEAAQRPANHQLLRFWDTLWAFLAEADPQDSGLASLIADAPLFPLESSDGEPIVAKLSSGPIFLTVGCSPVLGMNELRPLMPRFFRVLRQPLASVQQDLLMRWLEPEASLADVVGPVINSHAEATCGEVQPESFQAGLRCVRDAWAAAKSSDSVLAQFGGATWRVKDLPDVIFLPAQGSLEHAHSVRCPFLFGVAVDEIQKNRQEAIAKLSCAAQVSEDLLWERFYLDLGAWSPLEDGKFQEELHKLDSPLAKALGMRLASDSCWASLTSSDALMEQLAAVVRRPGVGDLLQSLPIPQTSVESEKLSDFQVAGPAARKLRVKHLFSSEHFCSFAGILPCVRLPHGNFKLNQVARSLGIAVDGNRNDFWKALRTLEDLRCERVWAWKEVVVGLQGRGAMRAERGNMGHGPISLFVPGPGGGQMVPSSRCCWEPVSEEYSGLAWVAGIVPLQEHYEVFGDAESLVDALQLSLGVPRFFGSTCQCQLAILRGLRDRPAEATHAPPESAPPPPILPISMDAYARLAELCTDPTSQDRVEVLAAFQREALLVLPQPVPPGTNWEEQSKGKWLRIHEAFLTVGLGLASCLLSLYGLGQFYHPIESVMCFFRDVLGVRQSLDSAADLKPKCGTGQTSSPHCFGWAAHELEARRPDTTTNDISDVRGFRPPMGLLPRHLQSTTSKAEQRATRQRKIERALQEVQKHNQSLQEALQRSEATNAELHEDRVMTQAELLRVQNEFDTYKQEYRKGQPALQLEIAELRKENARLMRMAAAFIIFQKKGATLQQQQKRGAACTSEGGQSCQIEDEEDAKVDRLCINHARGSIDIVPCEDPKLCARSAPEIDISSAVKPTYIKRVELTHIAGDNPSVGSNGHSDGKCAGFCQWLKTNNSCKFGTACEKCHVDGCSRVEGQRARRRRQASHEPSTGEAVGAASSSGCAEKPLAKKPNNSMASGEGPQ